MTRLPRGEEHGLLPTMAGSAPTAISPSDIRGAFGVDLASSQRYLMPSERLFFVVTVDKPWTPSGSMDTNMGSLGLQLGHGMVLCDRGLQ